MVQVTSESETPEQIAASFKAAGYDPPEVVSETPAAETAPVETSVPSEEPGEPAAAPTDGESGTAPDAVAVEGEVPARPKGDKESGSSRLKKTVQKKDSEISALTARLADQERRLAELSAAT